MSASIPLVDSFPFLELGMGTFLAIYVIRMVLDFLKDRKNGNGNENKDLCLKLKGIEETVEKTWSIHNRYDEDGSPLWYVPRSWGYTQKEIVNTCRDISNTQRGIADTLVRLEEKIDRSLE